FDQLQRDPLLDFYKKYYTFNHCKIFIAGKTPEHLDALLNKFFGKDPWNGEQQITQNDFPVQSAAEKKYRITNDPNGVQGAVRIARSFPNRYHPDVPKMQVLNTVLGGYFGSRLMSNIREEKGYTYGIFSALYAYNKGGLFGILTEAGREVTEATVTEAYKEMQRLCDDLIPEEELGLVRNYMAGGILGDLDGSFKVIRRWKNLILSGRNEDYFYNAIDIIKTISAKELQELAQKYFVKDDFYELVVV
ncbi:MAG: M16 family metallopeptidase, partial [Chitinophagaceae bacterium]